VTLVVVPLRRPSGTLWESSRSFAASGQPNGKAARSVPPLCRFSNWPSCTAKGVLEGFGFGVRMCPADGKLPHAVTPPKNGSLACIKPGSPFDLAVRGGGCFNSSHPRVADRIRCALSVKV